ncbi:hypothetical protein AU252_05215 [Pseudarthrobacter sulfonivorans]|uniref:Uncharacterized protein n=1 Tax=Pseudarthrobacter sulfonivorans TaxID=121292 RepID=A0A0U2X9J5_9MICC|nr:hypothetical protein [Pseudarthrobacter sulfonivorans]ALV40642.1 hypothetical protein AU252_05215 [Pseudarthrobacter sulfonivorans]
MESGTDIRANLAAIDRFAAEATLDGAGLVAFPEYATYSRHEPASQVPAVTRVIESELCCHAAIRLALSKSL